MFLGTQGPAFSQWGKGQIDQLMTWNKSWYCFPFCFKSLGSAWQGTVLREAGAASAWSMSLPSCVPLSGSLASLSSPWVFERIKRLCPAPEAIAASGRGQGSLASTGPSSKNLRPAGNMFRKQNKQLLPLDLFAQANGPCLQQPLQSPALPLVCTSPVWNCLF